MVKILHAVERAIVRVYDFRFAGWQRQYESKQLALLETRCRSVWE